MTLTQIRDNFKLIHSELQVANFLKLKPRVRAATLTQAFTLTQSVEGTDKRRLIAYLQAIAVHKKTSKAVQAKVNDFLNSYHHGAA